jgi:cytochrome c oxidase subunit 4
MNAIRTAAFTWLALLVLLAITAASSAFDLGWGNLALNLLIAVAKTILIVLVFMHLTRGETLLRLAAGAALFWLAILFALTFADYATR